MNCRLPRTATTETSFARRIANISCLAATLALLLTHDAIALNRPTVQYFGYSNISNETTELVEILDHGIPQNIWFIDYRDDNFIGDDAIQTGPLMFQLEALGTKQFLYIDDVLFENVLDPEELSLCDFLNLDGDSSNGGDPFHRLLRSDWTNRLQAWFDLHGEFINAGNTAGIVINAEVNNYCSDMGEVEMAAEEVKSLFEEIQQDIPRVILIGRSHWDADNPKMPPGAGARPMPEWITPSIDIVGFWSYGILDALDADHVQNVNPDFFRQPYTFAWEDISEFGQLVGLLNKEQKIIQIVDSHRSPFTIDWIEWTPSDFALCALNYELFLDAVRRLWPDKVIGYVLTSWPEASTMEEIVVDTHREIGQRLAQ